MKNIQKDLVSIIMPVFNSDKFLSLSIESVLNQTYENFELMIIDDGSIDNSLNIIQEYQKNDSRIILLKNKKNNGPAISRNLGIKYASGRFIAFLDSDDMWLQNKLEKHLNFMLNKNIALSYSAYYLIDEYNNEIGKFAPPTKISYSDLLKTNSIGCLTAIYDTDILGKVFMPLIEKRQDYALWLKILKQVKYAMGLNEYLAKYRIRKNSLSANKIKNIKYNWKIYREIENLTLIQSIYYFINYVFYGLKKYR